MASSIGWNKALWDRSKIPDRKLICLGEIEDGTDDAG
jgi:hypothetical protein